ncbi:MAG: ATP-binding protein [Syntrophorhabdaceae bacterium]|nr:ATP-binding protein [Syntrophorhabdaceae bacterium]
MTLLKKWQTQPIKKKFLLAGMSTTVVALFFVSVAFFINEIVYLKDAYQRELNTVSKTISNNVVSSLLFYDKKSASEIISNLSLMENIIGAAIYDREGRLFATYRKGNEIINFEPALHKKIGFSYSLRSIELFDYISFENQQIGAIYIKSDIKRIYKTINTIILTITLVVLFSVILSYFLLNRLQTLIIEPINNLANLMDAISRQRDYTKRAEFTTKDEIGYLAMVFNEMLDTIQYHDLELERYRKHLEELVKKRTEELIEKNEELMKELKERKKLEEQLIQSQKLEAIGTLAGGVAHDFNNLLTVVLGYGELLKQKVKDNEALNRYVENIITSAEKGKRLTEGLLAFSRKQMSLPKPMNLNEAVRDTEKILKRLIGEDIELKTLLHDKDIIVLADYGQIEQILINLVTNARDAMPKGGEIIIETSTFYMDVDFIAKYGYGKKGYYGVLKVTDTGMGMEKKVMERIFEPFFTTKEVGKGTGLGLSVVYGIVKQNKGFINVESELNKGSSFTVLLPIVESEVALKEKELIEIPVDYGRGETILLAEDDDSLRGLIKTVLEQFNYKVVESTNGSDAIEIFKEKKDDIALVILDVIMPKANGKEVYDRIKEIKPEIKSLFISGYTSDFLSSRDIAVEHLEFIQKPILPHELVKRVKKILKTD